MPDDSKVGDHEAALHPAVALRVFYWLYPVEHLLAQPQPKVATKCHQHHQHINVRVLEWQGFGKHYNFQVST